MEMVNSLQIPSAVQKAINSDSLGKLIDLHPRVSSVNSNKSSVGKRIAHRQYQRDSTLR